MSPTRDLRNGRFWRELTIHFLAAIGGVSAVLGLVDIFFPDSLSEIDLPLIFIVPFGALIFALCNSWPYPIEQHYSTPETKVRLVIGDLFDQETGLVIGMADTFDIETPEIIANDSVQGQFLRTVYKSDVSGLRRDVQAALADHQVVDSVKKKGNTSRYPLGTVATINHRNRKYYCVAYTSLDGRNKASSTVGILWESLEKLWDEVRVRSNGEAISSPVIGLGQSGMSTVLPIQDAIRFLILSFIVASRSRPVCKELRIVIRPTDEKRVDMLEIQEFLDSFKKSP